MIYVHLCHILLFDSIIVGTSGFIGFSYGIGNELVLWLIWIRKMNAVVAVVLLHVIVGLRGESVGEELRIAGNW